MRDQRGNRREYVAPPLRRRDLAADPVAQFERWFGEALEASPDLAHQMTLATATPDGMPSVRVVLLKHFDGAGFCFYSDAGSQKGRELAANPRAAACLHWPAFERQVRLAGAVERMSAAESDGYFATRPLDSRLSAAASSQSEPVADRAALDARVAALRSAHPDGDVPRPARWFGYRLLPDVFEFWQGQPGRLHDRFRYLREGADWRIERLQP